MANRKPLSKRVRFEVFKRDDFRCTYCGESPPNIVLHVDHVIPVVDGGLDDFDNLVSACDACNLGKGARPLGDALPPIPPIERVEDISERRSQLRAYKRHLRKWMDERREFEDEQIQLVAESLTGKEGVTWSRDQVQARGSVSNFIRMLGLRRVIEMAEVARNRGANDPFRYFCGCCHNEIRQGGDDA